MENQTPKPRGRPQGSLSGKYKDQAGNVIDVMSWRKLQGSKWRLKYSGYPQKHKSIEKLLTLIAELSEQPKDIILERALNLYLKEKLKQ